MVVVVVTLLVALVAGLVTAALVASVPTLDETGPRLGVSAIRRAVRSHPRLAGFFEDRPDPAALTGLVLSLGIVFVTLAVAGVGVLLAMVRGEVGLFRSDLPIAQWAAEQGTPQAADILGWVSRLGGTEAIVGVAVLVGVVGARRTGERAAVIALLALTVGGQFALSNLIKAVVERARPDLDQLTGHAGTSFPSGHATAAAATFAVAALVLGRGRSHTTKTALWGAAAAIAAAVAATRVMLGVHWTTDVLAGLLVGWGWFALCSAAFGGRLLRFGAPAVTARDAAVEAEQRR